MSFLKINLTKPLKKPDYFRDYLSFENLMNPSETNTDMSASGELTRITFNLKTRKVSSTSFPNGIDNELARYVNHIDFPAINEAYRGKEVNTPHHLDILVC